MPSWTVLALLLWTSPVSSILVNRTIDDQLGDSVTGFQPVYAPADAWNQGSNCTVCHINPSNVDTTQVFDGTWHDGTYDPGDSDRTIRLNFTGSAVYVFNLIPNTVAATTTLANISFNLDGDHVGTYLHVPDNTSNVLYRVPVYTNTSLDHKLHSLVMRATGTNSSLILFDFLIYTVDQNTTSSSGAPSGTSTPSSSAISSSSSSHSTSVGAIIGGTVGGIIAAVVLLGVLVFLFRRRRRNAKVKVSKSVMLEAKPYDVVRDPFGYGGSGYRDSPNGGSGAGGLGDGGDSGYGPSGYGPTGHVSGPSDAVSAPLLLSNPSLTALSRPSGQESLSQDTRDGRQSHVTTAPSVPKGLSQHRADLAQRIHNLEDQMRELPSPDATNASSRARRGSSGSGAALRALQHELGALRDELTGLNAQLASERRLAESLPQYDDVVGDRRRVPPFSSEVP